MSLSLHARKKIELVIDRPHLERYLRVLEAHGVRGYTVLPALEGKGSRGAWRPSRLTNAANRVLVLAVVDEAKAAEILEDLDVMFDELPGVAFVSDVGVLRPDRF
ncbi:MAG: DUF190 domain-containing protein [Myxococcota bacterium]